MILVLNNDSAKNIIMKRKLGCTSAMIQYLLLPCMPVALCLKEAASVELKKCWIFVEYIYIYIYVRVCVLCSAKLCSCYYWNYILCISLYLYMLCLSHHMQGYIKLILFRLLQLNRSHSIGPWGMPKDMTFLLFFFLIRTMSLHFTCIDATSILWVEQ